MSHRETRGPFFACLRDSTGNMVVCQMSPRLSARTREPWEILPIQTHQASANRRNYGLGQFRQLLVSVGCWVDTEIHRWRDASSVQTLALDRLLEF